MLYKKLIIFGIVLGSGAQVMAQDVLSREEAVNIALENNYQIRVVKNQEQIAANNTSIYNSGKLPTVSLNAGGNYNNNNVEAGFQNGDVTTVSWAESNSVNANISANYVVFNGFSRKYNVTQFMNNYKLSQLQSKSAIENVILQVYNAYYEVARLEENAMNLKGALKISKERLERIQLQNEYGQSNNLAISNALVDVNTDSINILNISQQLENSKRNLNLLLGRDIQTEFSIDTLIQFDIAYQKNILEEQALNKNTAFLLAQQNLAISEISLKQTETSFYPQLSVGASYGWNKNNNNPASFLAYNIGSGIAGNVSLTWNLFDGGGRYIRKANALIEVGNRQTDMERIRQELLRDFNNAWGNYTNALFVLNAQEDNLRTNRINFNRTEEQYRIGRVSSIEFRQAQLNLLNAQMNRNQSKYQAKLAEIELLRVSGQL